MGLVVCSRGRWARPQSQRGHLRRPLVGPCTAPRAPRPAPSPMAPRPLSPWVLALGGAAALLGSVLFVLWKTYCGRGRERRWDRGEGCWGAEPARLPEWDEWDVSAGPGHLRASDGSAWVQGLGPPPGRRELWTRGVGGPWALRGAASPRAVWGPRGCSPAPAQCARPGLSGGGGGAAQFPDAVAPSTRDGHKEFAEATRGNLQNGAGDPGFQGSCPAAPGCACLPLPGGGRGWAPWCLRSAWDGQGWRARGHLTCAPQPEDEEDDEPALEELEQREVLVLGLDGSGKSTFLRVLSGKSPLEGHIPTWGFNSVRLPTRDFEVDLLESEQTPPARNHTLSPHHLMGPTPGGGSKMHT